MSTYIPKGSMCTNCVDCLKSCMHLRFQDMRVIERGAWGFTVRCTEFKAAEKNRKLPVGVIG